MLKPGADVTGDSAALPALPEAGAEIFTIVAIGASAGGLEALEQFFSALPANSGMAFVVIQHLDPNRLSMLPELLQRSTAMPVRQAGNRMRVKPDCVYVIPPNKDLSILNGALYLLVPGAPHGLRLPIDAFLCSLAGDRHERAVGVVLSGMGADGTLGLQAIRAHGGMTLAQAPDSAKFPAMPQSAINAETVDVVAPADVLPKLIIERNQAHVACDSDDRPTRSALDNICLLLRRQTGHDFAQYKKNTLYRRIERRIGLHRLAGIAEYVVFLQSNPQELDLLFKEMLIGVTSFFRDPGAWAFLQAEVLPGVLLSAQGQMLRAWVAGCSSGEEAYTLAMAFREVLEELRPPGRVELQIFATDLDPDAIAKARQGCYPASIAGDVSPARLARFFREDKGMYRINQEIRQMVVFAPHNLTMDPPFTRLDIITCRNLLIYLGPELQKKLMPLFHYSLKPGGTLFLGSSESIGGFAELFSPIEAKARIFRREPIDPRALEVDFPTRHINDLPSNPPNISSNMPSSSLQSAADQLLLQKFSPAAVLTTAEGDVLFINGRTGKYLEPAAGKANWNIYAMARDGLRQELGIALPKALRTGEAVTVHDLTIGLPEDGLRIDLIVHPLGEPGMLQGMAMLVFKELPAAKVAPRRSGNKQVDNVRFQEMAQSLQNARDELQSLREEMQGSHEELKSANEELQSTNEELQSTNEELTTSKEEMQSLNEELQMVNAELQSKIDELSATSNDMKNLLNSTDIATVFLDSGLNIRRFTNQANALFKFLPGDVGRPLSDIVHRLDYPELQDDAREVLRTLVFSEKEIAGPDDTWYIVKILPYRTQDNVIDGVVITLIDISKAKHLEAELRVVQASGNSRPVRPVS